MTWLTNIDNHVNILSGSLWTVGQSGEKLTMSVASAMLASRRRPVLSTILLPTLKWERSLDAIRSVQLNVKFDHQSCLVHHQLSGDKFWQQKNCCLLSEKLLVKTKPYRYMATSVTLQNSINFSTHSSLVLASVNAPKISVTAHYIRQSRLQLWNLLLSYTNWSDSSLN